MENEQDLRPKNRNGNWRAEYFKQKLLTDNRWLFRGVIAIFRYQTSHEQKVEETIDFNLVGFKPSDAPFLSSIAKQAIAKRRLSSKQVKCTREAMLKYAGQLARIANNKQ